MDLPRSHVIRESSHRILDPLSDAKLATLGHALHLRPGMCVLDLACGKGELLCTWARDHQINGVGVDISTAFLRDARIRAAALEVQDKVTFVHGDASDYKSEEPVDVASCCGATWIGNGVAGTVDLLDRALRPQGIALVGEPYWRTVPSDQAAIEGCHASGVEDYKTLTGLVEQFQGLGWDVVEMVLAAEDDWDRYVAAQWFNTREWLDNNPSDELFGEMRADLSRSQLRYARYQRSLLGWGVFALKKR